MASFSSGTNTRLPWLLAAMLLAQGCSSDGDSRADGFGGASASSGAGGVGGSSNVDGSASGGTGNVLISDAGNGSVMSLAVDPPMATMEVVNLMAGSQQFQAIATYQDGSTGPVTANWVFDRPELGRVNATGGLFTQQGFRGGVGTVSADSEGVTATAQVTVVLKFEDDTGAPTQPEKDAFNPPGTTPSGTFVYPYDQTVFPRGLLPPELMWDGGGAGDKYKVTIRDAFVELTAYISADPPSRWSMADNWWRSLTESSDGTTPVSVEVQRLDLTGQAHQAMSQSWVIAPGSLRGTIYYWAVSQGAIMKINPGAAAPVPAFDPQPSGMIGAPAPIAGYDNRMPPWDANPQGDRCVACHTVSRDGTRLSAAFSATCDGSGECNRPWGIVDNATQTIELVSTYRPANSNFQALSPDGSRIVFDLTDFTMRLADPSTGAVQPSALDSMTGVAHPQFNHDGSMLAYVSSAAGPGGPIEMNQSNLNVIDFNGVDFANGRTIQLAATEAPPSGEGSVIAFPSFLPDGQWVIYQRGTYSRAKFGPAGTDTGFNNLFLSPVAGGAPIKLGRMSGANLDTKDNRRSYSPRPLPVAAGGYFWVAFTSPRTYGNRMVSTTDATIDNRKQLWVAAIDLSPSAGADPSHPAFLLPGQDLTTINMDPYWALEPCHSNGESCDEGFECCSGFCRELSGTFQCVPPVNDCSRVGDRCATSGDCCEPNLQCIAGVCSLPTPPR